MTETEMLTTIGRTVADLKQTRSKVATLNAALLAYARSLQGVSTSVSRLVDNPAAVDASSCVQVSEHVKTSIRQLSIPDGVLPLVDELVEESARAKRLAEIVSQF
jgi:hypothetical protein